MTRYNEAMIWGAVAGAATVIANIVALDPAAMFDKFNLDAFLGYCVRTVALMFLGAIVVRANNETSIPKAFQLGIMAPALILGIQSGAALQDIKADLAKLQGDNTGQATQVSYQNVAQQTGNQTEASLSFLLINNANAQTTESVEKMGSDGWARFLSGLTGRPNYVFAFVASTETQEEAIQYARQFSGVEPPCDVRVYLLGGQLYAVQLGGNLNVQQAEACVSLARKIDPSSDAFTFQSRTPRTEAGRVNLKAYIHVGKVDSRPAPGLDAIQNTLGEVGITWIGVDEQSDVYGPGVDYFHTQDKATAEAVARALSNLLPAGTPAMPTRKQNVPNPIGTLGIWF